MKASSATSARATGAPPTTGRSSARQPTPTSAESFALAGPSELPDPSFNAYRRDLADVALAGRVIASHYVLPVDRILTAPGALRSAPSNDAEIVADLQEGEPFRMLEDSAEWAWGYGGADRRVGYLRSEALAAA